LRETARLHPALPHYGKILKKAVVLLCSNIAFSEETSGGSFESDPIGGGSTKECAVQLDERLIHFGAQPPEG
jgi:hypothetical protein